MSELTGDEPWVLAGLSGDEVYAKALAGNWFPVVHIELDCGLITIDVCGMPERHHLYECEIKIGYDGDTVEDVYDVPLPRDQHCKIISVKE